jgi:hypothetical protein
VRRFEFGVVVVGRHGEVLCRIDRAHRGLRGDHQTAGGTGQNPQRSAGPERQRMSIGFEY